MLCYCLDPIATRSRSAEGSFENDLPNVLLRSDASVNPCIFCNVGISQPELDALLYHDMPRRAPYLSEFLAKHIAV